MDEHEFNKLSSAHHSKKALIIWTLVGFVLLIALVAFAFKDSILITLNPKGYISSALVNTGKSLSDEATIFADNHPLITKLSEIQSGAVCVKLNNPWVNDSSQITIIDDPAAKVINAQFVITDKPISLYVSNEDVVVVLPNGSKVGASAEKFSQFIKEHSGDYLEGVPDSLKDFELNYNSLHKVTSDWGALINNSSQQFDINNYSDTLAKILDYSKITITDGQITTDEGVVKCKNALLDMDAGSCSKLLYELADKIQQDGSIKSAFAYLPGAFDSFIKTVRQAGGTDTCTLSIKLSVIKDKIIAAEVEFKNTDHVSKFSAGTIGNINALDHIYLEVFENKSGIKLDIAGNHIGSGVFDSRMSLSSGSLQLFDGTLSWDPEKAKDNIVIKTADFTYSSTFARKGAGISVELNDIPFDNKPTDFTLQYEPYNETIEMPHDYLDIIKMSLTDIAGIFLQR